MAGSLADIARSLDVSVSLVSKVLSGRMGTTSATPEAISAIREYAEKIGYVKNSSAASLATGRQNVIGVYIHHHGTPGSALSENLVMGISAESFRCQQRLLLTYFTKIEEFESHIRSVASSIVDSIIIGGVLHPDLVPTMRRIQSSGVRIATVMDEQESPDFPNAGVNQIEVGAMACRHLLQRGCRRIAHINVMPNRYKGFQQALQEHGVEFIPELVYSPDKLAETAKPFGYESGVRAIETFLENNLQFDGLVTQSDLQAVGALHTLHKYGKRVPEDVRIIGVDNSPYCQFSVVPLSSVSQQEYQRGVQVVQYLMNAANPRNRAALPTVSPVLYARDSSR